MIKWHCTKCNEEWWCAGLMCPCCPKCEAAEIYPDMEDVE